MRKMTVGFVGLGRMGLPMVRCLLSHGIHVVAYDTNSGVRKMAHSIGADVVEKLFDLPVALESSARIVWMMVPIGDPVDQVILALLPGLTRGDVLVDVGNANYEDSIRRRRLLAEREVGFAGAGTSGGTDGALKGPPISVDCTIEVYQIIKPVLAALGGNHAHFTDAGKGHLAKTIHNAIEYGMMQSLAEGVALYVKHGYSESEIKAAFATWANGSIIESRLVTCLNEVMKANSILSNREIKQSETTKIVRGVQRSDCRTPVLTLATNMRDSPDGQDPVALTVLARLRNHFGAHDVQIPPANR